jgi:uncharacterized membrane protein YdfJ with MMPL/SSD domain
VFKKLGKFISRHGRATLVTSAIALGAAGFYGVGVFSNLTHDDEDFSDKSSQSYAAYEAITKNFSDTQADLLILFQPKDGKKVDDPAVKTSIESLVNKAPQGIDITTFYDTASEQLVSKDRTQTFATATIKEGSATDAITALRALESDTITTYVGGTKAIQHDVNHQVESDLMKAETLSFAILAVLLVIVFRSFVAAALPLLLGGVAILGAFFVTNVLTEFVAISNYAINVIIMIGLGLAIDYSLFVVGRFREELRAGAPVPLALSTTMTTAGRTVFFSGLTVILSLLSLLVFPLSFLQSMGLGGSAAVFVAMIAALIVLPALLRVLGHRVNALSFGSAKRDREAAKKGQTIDESQSFWHKSGRIFMRRSATSIVVVLAALLFMGAPFLHATFGLPDYRSLPDGSEAKLVAERLTHDFDVQASPIQVVVTTNGKATEAENTGKLYDYTRELAKIKGVKKIESAVNLPGDMTREQYQYMLAHPESTPGLEKLLATRVHENVALVSVQYDGTPETKTAQDIVLNIRELQPPQGMTTLVGGQPAQLHDLLGTLATYIPIGLGVIVVTLFILLFLMLGSIVIPLKAILMNILSLSTAYGAMVFIFQDGNLTGGLLGFTQTGSLDATMPVLIFAVAFGLSMDYSVFLYSRIKEHYDKTGDNEAAVLHGLQKTGSIITSASILLFVVVAAFATARVPLMQQIGVGLALTVLVDAFIVRMILVPALMKPLNHWNWWAPKPLKRLQEKLGLSE